MTGAQAKVAFCDMFPPALLFSEELGSMHAIYANIRDVLNSKGAALTPHSSRRILMKLAHSLYEDNEDAVAATEIARTILALVRQSTRSKASEASGTAGPSGTVSF